MRHFSVRKLAAFVLPAAALWVGCSPVAPSFLKNLAGRSSSRSFELAAPAPEKSPAPLKLRQWTWNLVDENWNTFAGTELSAEALTQLARFGRIQLQWNEDQLNSIQIAVGLSKDATPENPAVPQFAIEPQSATSTRSRPTWELRILNHSTRKSWDMDKVSLLPDRPLALKELL